MSGRSGGPTEPATMGVFACEALLARFMHAAVEKFGAGALGVLDLPSLSDVGVDPAQIRVAAVLLWCREMESAGTLQFAESLAEQVTTGKLLLPIKTAGARLAHYHRSRSDRWLLGERLALYDRVLGGPVDAALGRLVRELASWSSAPSSEGSGSVEAGLRVAARDLATLVSTRAVGVVSWAARDIMGAIAEAIDLLADPDLTAALGHSGLWNVLTWHGQTVLGRSLRPTRYFARAAAGRQILEWLADVTPSMDGTGSLLARTDPVITAANRWEGEGE